MDVIDMIDVMDVMNYYSLSISVTFHNSHIYLLLYMLIILLMYLLEIFQVASYYLFIQLYPFVYSFCNNFLSHKILVETIFLFNKLL